MELATQCFQCCKLIGMKACQISIGIIPFGIDVFLVFWLGKLVKLDSI